MHQSTNPRFGVDERTPYGLLRLATSVEKPLNEAEDTTVPNRLSHQVQQVQLANVGGESRYAMNGGAFRAILVNLILLYNVLPMKTAPKARPDKEKVIDEVWTDGRVKEFLGTITPSQTGEEFSGDHDFYVLLRAYHAMRVEDFEKFLEYFKQEGGNLHARNNRNQTVRSFISSHRKAEPFIAAIDAALTSPQ